MSESRSFVPNVYGKIVLLSVSAGLGALVLDGSTVLLYGAVALAVLAVAAAMHRNGADGDDEQYPHDREDHRSDRERKRQKELEGEKGRASGESA